MSLLSVITYLDRVAFSVTGSRMTAELGLSNSDFALALSAFSFFYGFGDIPSGYLGDRFGSKGVLIRIVLAWSFFTILTGFSYTLTGLLIVRSCFGLMEAGAYPNTAIIISKWLPSYERSRGQAIVWAGSRVGAAIAPLLIIPIMQAFGWREVFYIFGAIGFVWCVFFIFFFKEEPREMPNMSQTEIALIEAMNNVMQDV